VTYRFHTSCVNAEGEDIDALQEAAEDSDLETLWAECEGFDKWTVEMGYDDDFPIAGDWHVTYHRSTYRGESCYYVQHSGIEYIWTASGEGVQSPHWKR
jgi:hypothetical protein